MKMPAQIERAQEQARAFWLQREPRERKILAFGGAALAAIFIWFVLFDPALAGRARLDQSLPQLRQQAAELAGMAAQAGSLGQPQARGVVAPPTREIIDGALARLNLKAKDVLLTGDMVKLTFKAASFAAIVNLQDELGRSQHLAVVDAAIEPLDAVDTVDATLTFRLQGGGAAQ